MHAGDVVAIVLAVVLALVAGAVCMVLASLGRTLRDLRAAIDELRHDTLPVVDELHEAVTTTAYNVERVDRLITAAQSVEDRVDNASRLAYRAVQSPVVKALALGAGVQRTAQRLAGRQPAPLAAAATDPSTARRRRLRRKAG